MLDTVDYNAALYQIENPPEPTLTKTDLHAAIKKYVEDSLDLVRAFDLYKLAIGTVII